MFNYLNDILKSKIFAITCITVIIIILYFPSLWLGFICDDYSYLFAFSSHKTSFNNILSHLSGIPTSKLFGYFRPLNDSLFAFIELLFNNAFAHHFFNLILHILNAILLYFLLKRFIPSQFALLSSLLFTIWPTNVQSVVWISARPDLLFTLFCLLAIYFYDIKITSEKKSFQQNILLVIISFCAMASKETAIILPFVAIIIFFYRRSKHKKLTKLLLPSLKITTPLFIAPVLYLFLRVSIINSPMQVASHLNLFLVFQNIFQSYFLWFFRTLPIHSVLKGFKLIFGIVFILSFLISLFIILSYKKAAKKEIIKIILFLILSYFFIITPFVLFTGWPGENLQRSRYFYLPCLHFSLTIGIIIYNLIEIISKKFFIIIFILLIFLSVFLIYGTFSHIKAYSFATKIFNNAVEKYYNEFNFENQRKTALLVPMDIKGIPTFPYGFQEAIQLQDVSGSLIAIETYPIELSENIEFINNLKRMDYFIIKYDPNKNIFEKLRL